MGWMCYEMRAISIGDWLVTTALLIIDVQNDIVAGTGSDERQPVIDHALNTVVERLCSLREKAHQASVPVILVQHDGGPGDVLERGTCGWQIRAELAPQTDECLIEKKACDSFHETGLQDRLRALGISHLVIGGCQTQYCVDTTVRRAVSLGYNVTLIADGHMTGDTRSLPFGDIIAHHNETLKGFRAGEARVRLRLAADVVF